MKWLVKIFITGVIVVMVISFLVAAFTFILGPANQIKGALPKTLHFWGVQIVITFIIIFLLGIVVFYLASKSIHIPFIGRATMTIHNIRESTGVYYQRFPWEKKFALISPGELQEFRTGTEWVRIFIPSAPLPYTGEISIVKSVRINVLTLEEKKRELEVLFSGTFVPKPRIQNNRSQK